jgi:hypothetical protein
MKKIFLISLVSLGVNLSAFGGLFFYSDTFNSGFQNGGAIPNGNLNGWSDTEVVSGMVPYLSQITVSVQLTGSASAFNGDLYAYITDGSGTAILLNRIGVGSTDPFGNSGSGMNVTFSLSGSDIHLAPYVGGLTGNYSADGRAISPLSAPSAFDAPGTDGLGTFVGSNPNADWTLFIADPVSGGDNFSVVRWGLTIDAVPEPTNVALGIFGICAIAGRLRAAWKKSPGSSNSIDDPK